MSFYNKNKFYSLPLNKNIGCLGFLIGALILSIILFLGFFVGLFIIGILALFYVYKLFKKKIHKNSDLDNNTEDYTEAEYIEINDNDDNNK